MKNIIKKAIISEKATDLSEKFNRFSFAVERASNKIEIKNAVEKLYGVQVTEVRTMNYGGGKSSTKYTDRGIVEQPSKKWKKAVVTVAEGETIDLFNNF
jgi:large subunit ribosomal protein L23